MSVEPNSWCVLLCRDGFERARELEAPARSAGFTVVTVGSADDLAAELDRESPIVVVLSDAVEGWLRRAGDLHRARKLLRILLVTDLNDRVALVTALNAGVDGIARPDDRPDALLGSITGLCELGVSLPRAMTKDLVGEIRAGRGHVVRAARGYAQVTNREWQILQLLAQGRTTREMADELFVAVGTVRSHVSALLAKLGVASRSGAVELLESSRSNQ